MKPRTRLYIVGQATYRRVKRDMGWGGPYGQDRRPARWACIDCGREVWGTDDKPMYVDNVCSRNGHAPCHACGRKLPRLNDGCPREHNWRICPGKTEADRMNPQHADKGHTKRKEGTP